MDAGVAFASLCKALVDSLASCTMTKEGQVSQRDAGVDMGFA